MPVTNYTMLISVQAGSDVEAVAIAHKVAKAAGENVDLCHVSTSHTIVVSDKGDVMMRRADRR